MSDSYNTWTDDELIEEADERTLSRTGAVFLDGLMAWLDNHATLTSRQRKRLIEILEENNGRV